MAYYLVKAQLDETKRADLRKWLDSGEIEKMRPFGEALQWSLDHARVDSEGWVVWEEEDYCTPPLDQERKAVLDAYFTGLTVQNVKRGEGWQQIDHLPRLW